MTKTLDADTLAQLAARESRGEATVEERAWLDAHAEDWFEGLKSLIRDLNAQFAAAKEDDANTWLAFKEDRITKRELDARLAERLEWRRRATGMRRHVEDRLRYVRDAVKERHRSQTETENQIMRFRYREAIKEHRRRAQESDLAPTEWDIDLWDVLSELPDDARGGDAA